MSKDIGIDIKDTDKILVVAPHPDDDCIGLGGLLSLYAKNCDVLLVTDGYDESMGDSNICNIRLSEFETAMRTLGVNDYKELHLIQYTITENIKAFNGIDFKNYDYVFIPNRHEYHKDHIAVYKAVSKLCKREKSKAKVVEYEVWTTLRKPNIYIDITTVIEKKRELIEIYKSQTKDLDYVNLAMGLNAYRGISRKMCYAEAFYCERQDKTAKLKQFKKKLKSILKRK